jgi:hypothetical protein
MCLNCNGGLGQFHDSTDAPRTAAIYVDQRSIEVRELTNLARERAGELCRRPG